MNAPKRTLEDARTLAVFLKHGGWIVVLALAVLVSLSLNVAQFVDNGRWVDRYTGAEASRDWASHVDDHQKQKMEHQRWVIEEINTRVPPREVIERLVTLETMLSQITSRLDKLANGN